MPVEPEDAAEGLKPVRVGQPPQHLRGAGFAAEINDDFAGRPHHPAEKPGRRLAAMERKGGETGSAGHGRILSRRGSPPARMEDMRRLSVLVVCVCVAATGLHAQDADTDRISLELLL